MAIHHFYGGQLLCESNVRHRKLVRKILLVISLLFVLFTIGLYATAGYLVAPRLYSIGAPPSDLPIQQVDIPYAGAKYVSGWFAGKPDMPGILLLHSVRSDRREMLGRARFLFEAGFSVLLIDLQGHGESSGEYITFGVREAQGVRAATQYLREKTNNQKIGVIGMSLGGAATLLGEAPIIVDAVVLEAVYSDIKKAVQNRLAIRFGKIGEILEPLLTWQIEPRLGIPLEKLSPVNAIVELKVPVMIIGGSDDRHTLLEESELLFKQASEPKRFWTVEGAAHQNFHSYAPKEYEERVLGFFEQYLLSPYTD